MPKVIGGTLAALLLAVALTGCAGTAPAPDGTTTAVASSEPSPTPTVESAASVEAAPLVVTPQEPDEPTADLLQSEWYQFVGATMQDAGYEFPEMSDALALGQLICDQARAGSAPDSIVAVEGLPEAHAFVNAFIVNHTLMNGYQLTEAQKAAGETLPDYCGEVFPPA